MRYYVKVTKEVAEVITKAGVPLTMTHDGNCLLYQSEMNDVPGVNLSARAAYAGGALIEEYSALAEIDGSVATPAYCYTPVEYGGEGDTRNKDNGFGADMPDASASESTEETPATEVSTDKKESEVTNE
jgi:hypothetical protein|nr:MAG TPA: hypothetical protein [Caudoviricetes sp.]